MARGRVADVDFAGAIDLYAPREFEVAAFARWGLVGPIPFNTPTGELLVFAPDTNNELVAFYRSSGGEWKLYNVSANVPGNPGITGQATPLITLSGEVLVFASDTNKELVSFSRTTGGEWNDYNVTSALGGIDITQSPSPFDNSSGELQAFAPGTSNQALRFYRTSGGEWKYIEI